MSHLASSIARTARSFGSATVISILTLQLAVGCGSPSDPGPREEPTQPAAEAPEEAASGRMKMWTEIEGSHYSVDLVQERGRLTGVRTVMHADGSSETENIDLPLTEAGDPMIEQTFLDAGLGDLQIVSSQATEKGMLYELETASGLVLHVETEGDVDYAGPAVVAAASVLRVALVVCGAVAIANITACMYRDRCWSYNVSLFRPWTVCSGSCQTCL